MTFDNGEPRSQASYTVGELATAAGVTARTVRYYTAEGLLPPPHSRGRYAEYGRVHLARLRLAQRLKAAYFPLREIAAELAALTDQEVDWLTTPPAEGATPPSDRTRRLAELLRVGAQRHASGHAARERPPSPPGGSGRRVLWIDARGSARPDPAVEHESIHEEATESAVSEWRRVTLAPGVELHVRIPDAPDAQEQLARKVAEARALFRVGK